MVSDRLRAHLTGGQLRGHISLALTKIAAGNRRRTLRSSFGGNMTGTRTTTIRALTLAIIATVVFSIQIAAAKTKPKAQDCG